MKLPQVSLRELLLLVALVALGCGWWVDRSQLANRVIESEESERKAWTRLELLEHEKSHFYDP